MQDEETLAHEARWFIKEYQFVTDTYRLFSMLSCLAGDPQRPLFHSTPNMKFMLRQIKAMDYSLPDHITKSRQMKPSAYHERAALSTRNELGEEIPADSMDVALLVLYGHILYSGNSFYPALNYFFRAYALDPHNPAVLLSLALCYIHQSLKRQSENRHFLIMQGLAFMHEYRRVREAPGTLPSERQEMEFNFARTFHMLGLAHLAVDGYRRVLGLGEVIQREAGARARAHANAQLVGGQKQSPSTDGQDVVMGEAEQSSTAPGLGFVEDFSREAAVALQSICALGGDLKAAKEVTERWLVI
jgi:general transcription factor 3C polypeptide 3 (transcription factor C subunit 4)